jgi:hypothetical protein
MWTQKKTNDNAITTEKPLPLDNMKTRLSGDNDGRECERWKESQKMILLW